MPAKSNKQIPSELDWEVWRLTFLEGMDRKQIAQTVGRKIDAVDYHIAEGKRLIAQNVAQCQDVMRHLALPVSFNGLRLIDKAFRTQDPKYLDGAIRFLRNAGVTIEQSEVNHVLKDSRSADQDFDDLMKKMKERAVDATIIDDKQAVNSDQATSIVSVDQSSDDAEQTSTATPTSIQERDVSILPLTESHTENPKSVSVSDVIDFGDDETIYYVRVDGMKLSKEEIESAIASIKKPESGVE